MLFPFPWDSHGNGIPMGFPTPMHTSSHESALTCCVHGKVDETQESDGYARTGQGTTEWRTATAINSDVHTRRLRRNSAIDVATGNRWPGHVTNHVTSCETLELVRTVTL